MNFNASKLIVSHKIEEPIVLFSVLSQDIGLELQIEDIFVPVQQSPSQPPRVRKEFPETWIWERVTEIGLVIFICY